ncbi:hypothetical protein MSG28_001835 [Choristoneura fumiferana]|uniref:Uncharacterized protein n=1 Tax=Choristoneura fumiferana TaxID=7141 RepID=A0ACC0KWQ8_CHOFU|nr:hypothetical protein MSG28_001835 [Choristoneura fumiferana]
MDAQKNQKKRPALGIEPRPSSGGRPDEWCGVAGARALRVRVGSAEAPAAAHARRLSPPPPARRASTPPPPHNNKPVTGPEEPVATEAVALKAVGAVSPLTAASAPVRGAPAQSSYALERRPRHDHHHRPPDPPPPQSSASILPCCCAPELRGGGGCACSSAAWSSRARSSIIRGNDSFTDLGLHDKKICTCNDSFTDHRVSDKHFKNGVRECNSSSDENRSSGHASMSDSGGAGEAGREEPKRTRQPPHVRAKHRAHNKLQSPWPGGGGLEDIRSAIKQLTLRSRDSSSTATSGASSGGGGSNNGAPDNGSAAEARRRRAPLVRQPSLDTVCTNVTSADEFVWVDSHNRLVELRCVPWTASEIGRALQTGRCRELAPRLAPDTPPRLAYLLQRALVRISREAQRLSQNFGFCSKHEVAGAFRIVLSTPLADACIKGCQRAATMYATSGSAARRLGSAARARTSLAPGRFQRWMLDVRVASFVHEYAAIYLCAGIETLLEEIALIAGSSAATGPVTPAVVDHAVANCADLWGLLQPYSHLNAGRVASGALSLSRWESVSSMGSGSSSSASRPEHRQLGLSHDSGITTNGSGGSGTSAGSNGSSTGSGASGASVLLTTCAGSAAELRAVLRRVAPRHAPLAPSAERALYYFMRCSQFVAIVAINMNVRRSPPASPSLPPPESESANVKPRRGTAKPSTSAASSSTNELSKFRDDIKKMLHSWKNEQENNFKHILSEQNVHMSKLTADLAELKTQNSAIHKTNQEIEKCLAFVNQQYEDMKLQIVILQKEKREYLNTIQDLEKKITDIQQSSRSAAIEIRNVPANERETTTDLAQIVSSIGNILSVSTSGVRDIYRIPGKPGTNKPIVAEFNSVETKNKVVAAAKTYNRAHHGEERLNTTNIGFQNKPQPIYISEHLPSSVKKIFYLAREFAKVNKYQFCWSANGKVFLRKEQGAKHIVVKSANFLSELQNQP